LGATSEIISDASGSTSVCDGIPNYQTSCINPQFYTVCLRSGMYRSVGFGSLQNWFLTFTYIAAATVALACQPGTKCCNGSCSFLDSPNCQNECGSVTSGLVCASESTYKVCKAGCTYITYIFTKLIT
jgi:hypothetical protein